MNGPTKQFQPAASLAERIAQGLKATSAGASQWIARCPAHDDRNPSLAITAAGNGLALVHCHAGCTQESVIAALRERGLWGSAIGISKDSKVEPINSADMKPDRRIYPTLEDAAQDALRSAENVLKCQVTETARHVYPDMSGSTIALMIRFESNNQPTEGCKITKTFRPIHPAGEGWCMGDPPGEWPMYRLPEISGGNCPIYICEGEKAANAAAEMLLASTTSAHGSQSPGKTDWSPVSGRDVVILPDNDEAGRKYARCVADLTHKAGAKGVKIVELPALPDKGDIVEWIEARPGKQPEENRSELEELVRQTEPWRPPSVDGRRLDPIDSAKTGNAYAQTDLGNAERLVALHGHEIRWDTALKAWRVWDGRRWAVDSSLKLNTMAAETVRSIRREAASFPSTGGDGGPDKGKALFAWAVRSEGRDRISAMIELARAQPGIAVTQESWDANPWLLNVENGTIDLRIGALLEHDPANMLTKLTRVVYERDRKDERWDRFLRDATGNDEAVMEFLQAAAGYILSGSTAEEILLIIYGPEASGKTTYLEALRAVMGEYGKTITSDLLIRRKYARDSAAPSPDLAALAGVRLATCSEMDEGRDLAPAMVKNLTGGDTITARHLNAGLFDYMPQFKILLALNHCPYIPADDGALWRRIRRVGFERTVPPEQRDNTLKPYLRDPLGGGPAVLAWAVEGCLRWQKEGLNVPTAVHESTSAYREESDPLAEFFAETIEFREGARVMSEDLQLAYASYAKEHGISERDGVPLKKIWERLKQNHCVAIRRHAGRSWEGCTLKTTRVDSPRDGVTPRDTNDRDFLREGDSREGTGNAVTVCHAVTLSAPAVELARGTVADSSMMVQPEPSCCRPSVATTRTQAIVDDFGM